MRCGGFVTQTDHQLSCGNAVINKPIFAHRHNRICSRSVPSKVYRERFTIANQQHQRNTMVMMQEFKEFAIKGNVVDLAVGVTIGAAFGKTSRGRRPSAPV
jgi:hypothetical protein